MLERLEQIEARYEELANELSAPELLADQAAYTKAARQHRTSRRDCRKVSHLEDAQRRVNRSAGAGRKRRR